MSHLIHSQRSSQMPCSVGTDTVVVKIHGCECVWFIIVGGELTFFAIVAAT